MMLGDMPTDIIAQRLLLYGRINTAPDGSAKPYVPGECRFMAISTMKLLEHVQFNDVEERSTWKVMLEYLETYATETDELTDPSVAVDFPAFDLDGNHEAQYYIWKGAMGMQIDRQDGGGAAEETRTENMAGGGNDEESESEVEEIPAAVFMQVARRGRRRAW